MVELVTDLFFPLLFLLVIMDISNTQRMRDLVFSFLLSRRNIKGAKKIHKVQTRKDRITLKYIENYTKYPNRFKTFQKIWVVHLYSLLPRYCLIVFLGIFFRDRLIYPFILVAVLSIASIIFGFFISFYLLGRISIFDKRYEERQKK